MTSPVPLLFPHCIFPRFSLPLGNCRRTCLLRFPLARSHSVALRIRRRLSRTSKANPSRIRRRYKVSRVMALLSLIHPIPTFLGRPVSRCLDLLLSTPRSPKRSLPSMLSPSSNSSSCKHKGTRNRRPRSVPLSLVLHLRHPRLLSRPHLLHLPSSNSTSPPSRVSCLLFRISSQR